MSSLVRRRIFFWLLVAVFFVVAPLLIAYALGYRYNAARGVFVYAGSITIKANPPRVSVSIDGESADQKKLNFLNNSYHIDGLRPGKYDIEVTAPGFHLWGKSIEVHSGVSTEFWSVLLAKESYPRTQYNTPNIAALSPSAEKNIFAYTTNESGEYQVLLLDAGANSTEEVFSSVSFSPPSTASDERVAWSPKTDTLLIPAVKNETLSYFLVDRKTKRAALLDDIRGENTAAHNAQWLPKRDATLIYLSKGDLVSFPINNPDEARVIATGVAGYGISGNDIFIIYRENGIVYRIDADGKDTKQITTSPPQAHTADVSYHIVAYDEKRVALLDVSGNLTLFNEGERDRYMRPLSSGVIGIQFSDDGKKMLFFTRREVFVYFTRDRDVQPQQKENDTVSVGHFFESIDSVQWAKNYEHILYTIGKSIQITELDGRGKRNTASLEHFTTDRARVFSDFGQNTLYFTDADPKTPENTTLFSIPFPEPEGLFGL